MGLIRLAPITSTIMGSKFIIMELNTAVSVISEQTYKTTWNAVKAPPIEPTITCNYICTQVTLFLLGEWWNVTVNHKQ